MHRSRREWKSILDELVRASSFDRTPDPEERLSFEAAVRSFLSAEPDVLDGATEPLWAYYRSTALAFNAEDRMAYGIPDIQPKSDIWDHVDFRSPPEIRRGGTPLEPAPAYLSFEGEVSWEPEHGLQLVFEHGQRVCKVGPYDGHNTNAHAFADRSLIDVIFKG